MGTGKSQFKVVRETEFAFLVKVLINGEATTKAVYKPTENAAEGWVRRGMAQTEREAIQVATTWAGY